MAGFNPYYSIAKRLMRLRKKPIIVRRFGAIWKLYPNDWIDNRILICRPFEREQLKFARECFANEGLTVFFDAGANIGLYSVVLGTTIPKLTSIHAFEPVPQTHSRLVTNLDLNGLSSKATAYNYGLGARTETLDIVFNANSSGTSTLDDVEKSNPKRHFTTTQTVKICKFDSQFEKNGQRAFFKLDIEGHEGEALKGMEKYLANNNCVLQIELWQKNENKVVTWLAKRGYMVFNRIHHDVYFKRGD